MPEQAMKKRLNKLAIIVIPIRFIRALPSAWRGVSSQYKQEQEKEKLLFDRQRMIQAYLSSHSIKKLQIGTGTNPLPGWLNTDLEPTSTDTQYLNACERFPFDDNTFDFIYSEHMIEHITYLDGLFMLKECFRVMKPGGRIRIATPDIEKLIGLFSNEKTDMQKRYIEWSTTRSLGLYSPELTKLQELRPEWAIDIGHIKRFYPDVSQDGVCFVVNNFFRSYGHKFLYDSKSLSAIMREAGFGDVKQYSPGESDFNQLIGLESHNKMIGDDINQFETMILEAGRKL